ncbi:hypothetical protein JVT61DRAFT_4951 [Boletus reticuloceps]|uniref:Heterokaryon incompatibility domain-containing protein n=1 Tax=Boletus reticuloceps TaxID=495285 RepID=A0A8I2Z1J3_9AGAM|nr:hypothetical protein JVT61DRAFT_4951 [Boletus reticuloceps]
MPKREIQDRLGKLLRFAIFSHRWFQEGEPSFRTIDPRRPFTRGYHKLIKFCEKAAQFGCRLAWSDTCCIDKTSSAELDEAIRSMFRWYRLAHVCIVHLSDATSILFDELEKDVWFTRGWTLQELLAPRRIKFYGRNWNELTDVDNDKDHDELMVSMSRITNIPIHDLRHFQPGTNRIRERMSWASKRTTTRTEDIAYSLIGIFDVNLPIAYGEGTWAFHRLMEVIIHRCDEWGIFAWAGPPSTHHSRTSAIPQSPACYHLIDVGRFPSETEWVHGDTSFTLSRQGLFLTVMIAIGDIERSVDAHGEEHYEFTVKPSHAGPTFTTVHIDLPMSDPINVKEHEWAIGILNYREVEPKGEYGKLEGDRSYVSFLLHRGGVKEPWTRVPTDNILIVNTLFESESREPLCGLWL